MSASVCLLDAEPELTAGVPDDDARLGRRVLTLPLYELPTGDWTPRLLPAHRGGFGVLLTDGAIIRQIEVADRRCTHIVGPGDVLQEPSGTGLLECPVTWTVLAPSRVVVLDRRFSLAAQRWPSLSVNLQRRLLDQADRIALRAATAQLPRVERRILALFWDLAERWGNATPFGVEVPLTLTHEQIGRLAGARRPTVTLALGELAAAGLLTRPGRGGWLLSHDSLEQLRAPDAASSGLEAGERVAS